MFLVIWSVAIASIASNSWVTVNDTVMGGVSSSNVRSVDEGVEFSGVVSKENNGGFASIRTAISLEEFTKGSGITIQANGTQLEYQVVVWLQGYGPRLYYRHSFYPTGTRQYLSFMDFEAVSYGRTVQAPPLTQVLDRAASIGILVGGGYEGDFSLSLQQIQLAPRYNKSISSSQRKEIIAAIESGVPVFNQGKPEDCATIYKTLLQDFLVQDLPPEHKQRVQAILETVKTIDDPIQQAWVLRHALDAMLLY